MTPKTAQLLSEALESISDHLESIEAGKSDKWIHETVSKITDARLQLLKEQPGVPTTRKIEITSELHIQFLEGGYLRREDNLKHTAYHSDNLYATIAEWIVHGRLPAIKV